MGTVHKGFALHRFQRVEPVEVVRNDTAHLGAAVFGIAPQCAQQFDHGTVPQSVEDPLAVAARAHETGASQYLEVLRDVGEREAGELGQTLDTPLALRRMLQQFEPVSLAQHARQFGELFENLGLGV